jgi:SHS2 domain-containing protein
MMFRWVDHTSELELEIEAASEADVFAEALAALAELLANEPRGEPVQRHVSVAASDRPALLAAWLEELVFLAESDGFEPAAVEWLELGPESVEATVIGRFGAPPPLVKAVTYHRLAFGPSGAGYCATVVLDV